MYREHEEIAEEIVELGVVSVETQGEPLGVKPDDHSGLFNPITGGLSND